MQQTFEKGYFCINAFFRIFNTTSRLPDSPKLSKNLAGDSFFHVQHLPIEKPLVIWVYLAYLMHYKSVKPIGGLSLLSFFESTRVQI